MPRRTTTTRRTTISTTRAGGASGGGDDESEATEDDQSMFSPLQSTRAEEKQRLQGLNDRLSQYIDKVRSLEAANSRLSYKLKETEEQVVRERDGTRATFQAELADTRRLLDETSKDRAKAQLDAGKIKALNDELKDKINDLEKQLKSADARRRAAETQATEAKNRAAAADQDRAHWEDEARKLKIENADLTKQLASSQKQLESETLLRVDLENRLQSTKEELEFQRRLHAQEVTEIRQRRQTEIQEIDEQKGAEYEARLLEGLQAMREDFDNTLEQRRIQEDEELRRKKEELRREAELAHQSSASARTEIKTMRTRMETAEREREKASARVGALEKKIQDLENDLAAERDSFYTRLSARDDEIRRMKIEIDEMQVEYSNLMDTKVKLDVEIEAYRQLLESEETRLKLSPGSDRKRKVVGSSSKTKTVTTTSSSSSSTKRRRAEPTTLEETSYRTVSHSENPYGLEISDHDAENGGYVRVKNNSNEDIQLGNWTIVQNAGSEEIEYKFHRSFVLKANSFVTIWSSDSSVTHHPPTDLVMKEKQWPAAHEADIVRSTLHRTDGEQIAMRESTASTEHRTRVRPGYRSDLSTSSAASDPNCSIM